MDDEIRSELVALRAELERLNRCQFMQFHASWPRVIFFNIVRGLMVGLGTVLGASILISMVVWSLSKIEFVPIVGDLATQVIHQVEAARMHPVQSQ